MSESGKVSLPTPERIEEKKQISVTVSRMPEEKINDLYDKICELAHAEDGEQLEGILSDFNLMNVGYDAAWDEVERLLAALEEAEKEKDKAIDLLGDNLDDKAALVLRHGKEITELRDRLYEANQDAETEQKLNDTLHETNKELRKKLIEAQQTIARQREAFEKISKLTASNPTDLYWRGADAIEIARKELGNKEGSDKA